MSYKEINELAGYTSRVHQMFSVIDDASRNKFERAAQSSEVTSRPGRYDTSEIKGRVIVTGDTIETKNIHIVTPIGDLIVKDLNIKIEPGIHVFITGPNGKIL
jgi:ABC-type uncharacterized transport system fused permease/ATPase subunit